MSRAINTSLATIQFQVNARQASAAMQALQDMSNDLNSSIDKVNRNIANLGKDVPKDNPQLLNYQNQLAGLKKDLKDVEKAQRDFLKGAKAADQLWQAAQQGNIESLSFRSIKAGVNGLKKRQEGLSPGDAQDMKDWRIIKEVIDEADRVVKQAGADVQNVVQTIREGGKVSEQAMRQTISTLKELKGSVDETDADFRTYGNDLDFMEAKLQEFSEAQRRAKGEIVDANDARREMNKLTEEGAAAAKREAEEAEQLVASLKQESEELVRKRGEIKQNIEDTQKQIDENHKLIEEKHRQLAADEETFNAEQQGRRESIDGLKQQAEAERKLANEKSDAAETHRRAADLQKQTTEQLTEKVTELQGKLAALNAEPVKPKVDASEIERIERHLKNIANLRKPQQKIIDDYEAKYGKTSGEQYEAHRKRELEASLKDASAQEAAVEKVNKKWDDFWKKQEAAAQEFARSLGKSLDEIFPEDITSEQLSGPLAKSAQAAYKVTARRDYEFSEALGREGKLTEYKETARRYEGDDSPEAKVIESLTRKYREYVKELNEATTSDAEAKKVRAELREESDAYILALGQMQGFQEAENNLLQKKEGLLKQSTQKSEQQIQLEGQLADAKEQLRLAQEKQNDEQQEYVKLQGEAIEQGNKAAAAETKLADAQSEATQKQADFNQKQKEGLDNINQMAQGNQALQQSIDGLNGELEQNSKDFADNANKATEAEQQKAQARQLSIKRMEEMLAVLQKEYREEELTAEQREEHIKQIQQLEKAISTEKAKPALQMMTERMDNLGALSASALEETKRFWETMAQGADKGSEKLATAEAHIKALVEEEQKRSEAQAGKVIGDMGSYSDKEIAEAVKSFEQLRDAQTHGNDEWRKFNELAEQGKQHLEELAKADALAKMEERMSNLTNLSDAALSETKKYWEALKAGAEQGSEDLTKAETNLTRIIDLEKERTRIENERKAQIVSSGGSLNMYSEAEITEAIKAAKELHSHMVSADPEARKLADSIAKAEAHIRQYGIEAARTAQRQEELDATMQKQFQTMINGMRSGVMPSQAAVKSQMNYWQKLIDDPKTAAESLQFYRDQLAEVKKMYDFMIKSQGESALAWFQQGSDKDASGNQIKEMADKLKEYRGTLLKETNADEIAQIDAILQRIGASAKKATEDMMDFEKAQELALQAGDDVYGKNNPAFLASPEEIQAATKSIEKYREEMFKLIKQKKDAGEATDDEEAKLQELAKYLKDLKFEQDNFNMSREKMEELMKTPVNAINIDELRAAIKRADAELKRMEGSLGQNNAQYKAFAEQVRNAKNQLKEMEGQAKASATAWEKAWSRLKTYVVMYMGFNAVWQKVMSTADDLMELSDKMGEVRKTTGFTADEVGRLSDNLKRLDVRTPLTQLMEISAKAGQLGLKTEEDVMGFTEAANKLMIALPEMGAEAATEMMKVAIATGEVKKIQDQLNKGLIEGSSATEVALSKVGSVIDQLRANSAAAAPQITDFVKRVGAVGAQSNISIDQVAALGATVDALGMRVEMSATALSRMIPAIKNNAFAVANAIGMAPNALRALFDEADGGMEAMLAIFQHIKDSGMDADSIDKMLGLGGLKEVMKELNQQGARAGIVFAGLSQNVDELRRNLSVAREAYEDNIAILQEYNKMNDTTAAKWERFKNQLEEFFVGDFTQRFLGGIIDFLRLGLDFLTGNNGWSAAFRTIGVYLLAIKLNIAGIFSGVKNISFSLKGIAMAIGLIDKETKKLAWGNIFTALGMAALWAWGEVVKLKSALKKANESLGKTQEEIGHAKDRFEAYWVKLKDTSAALEQAKASHEKLSAEVDKLRKSTDGSAESTAKLKKKEDELTTSEKNVTKASNDHKGAISQMNSIYGKYLGFILTEANYSDLAASAHDKVTAAIEREMLMKQKQAALGEVDSKYAQDIATGYGDLNEKLVSYGGLERSEAAKAMSDLQKFMRENMKYDAGTGKTVVNQSIWDQLKKKSRLNLWGADANDIAALWFDQYLKDNFNLSEQKRQGLTGIYKNNKLPSGWGNVYTPFATNLRSGYAESYAKREQERGPVSLVYDVDADSAKGRETTASGKLLENLEKSAQSAKKVILDKNVDEKKRNEAYGELANALEGLDNRINELDPQKDAETINRLNVMAKSLKGDGIDIKKLKMAREQIHQTLFERATFDENAIKNLDTTNPWGKDHEAASTDWKNMTPNQLVNRRKQMNEFVKAIQTDSDIESVLAEDKALQKAIEKGMAKDMRTVVEWYNTERLKIQSELDSRHLTNTGAWKDPKQERARKKRLQDDMKAYLEELDAYYTERKTEIERARNDEEISEAEAWNRNIKNEAEWHKRRAELQIMYSNKHKKIAEDEQDAISAIIAERTGDDAKYIKATIANTRKFSEAVKAMNDQGAKEYRKFQGDLGLGSEKDWNKVEKALTQHLKAIEDIVNKERPFNGIAKNMQDNLGKMGILTADMAEGADSAAEELKRITFLLGEAENAYTMTVEKLLDDMRQHGFKEWADVISKDPSMQQGMLAMLRMTFDSVQDAIKKESSIIKKQVEIMMQDITDQVQADTTRMQILQNSVSRANSLIGAGTASERVADKLAIKQIQLQITMQETRIRMLKKAGADRVALLQQEADLLDKRGKKEEAKQKRMDAENVEKSVGLTLTKEQVELDKQRVSLSEKLEETQNRLYTELREWASLLTSSMQSIFEASHAGDAEYYNELAKMRLTGKGGPGAGTYIVIDNEGTEDATAHYEYLNQRQALERQHEIEIENARAEAWKKVWDDINMKINDSITDWMNAYLQNQSIDANTAVVDANTLAIKGLTEQLAQGLSVNISTNSGGESPAETPADNGFASDKQAYYGKVSGQNATPGTPTSFESSGDFATDRAAYFAAASGATDPMAVAQVQMDANDAVTQNVIDNKQRQVQVQTQGDKQIATSNQSTIAKMIQATNLYGVAYQAMSNDNLDAAQKFQMIALQAVGNVAMVGLQVALTEAFGKTAVNEAQALSKDNAENGSILGPILWAIGSALVGGLMGLAASKVASSKSQIAQMTGASVGAGRLATGMLTYAEGNVNEFTDPGSLTPGRHYNVDGADGKTYRAKYMGEGAKTHITSGPEFHLVGEAGREAIIDAHTTRNIQLNEPEIWGAIKTLYNGGSLRHTMSRRGRGVRAFAEGNVGDFEEVMSDGGGMMADSGFDPAMLQGFQQSLDRNSAIMEQIAANGIHAYFDVYGKGGLVDSYDTGKKTVKSHGERY